jgi:hypothetical protein
MQIDPKSAKKYSQVISHSALLGLMRVKSVGKYVGEINPRTPNTAAASLRSSMKSLAATYH